MIGHRVGGYFCQWSRELARYVYREDGSWSGCVPADPDDDILGKMLDLKRLMAEKKGAAWHQCLVQVSRAKRDLNVEFDYDDPQR